LENKLISVENLSKKYDDKVVLNDLNFSVDKNEFVTILGPSGCGKTTLLRILGGFERQDSGNVYLKNTKIDEISAHDRDINTVFQKYSLFPHMNVFDNIAFGLKLKKLDRKTIEKKVIDALNLVSLVGFSNRKVDGLSGGEQQRVAVARALVMEPKVLLLDEPLSALDRKLRVDMQRQLKHIQKKSKVTFIYVTHDQEEAMSMSDRVIVLNDGIIQQISSPDDVYNEPENLFVADFVGINNILKGKMIKDCCVKFLGREFECVDKDFGNNVDVNVIVRPEDFDITEDGHTKAKITEITFKGLVYELQTISHDTKVIVHTTKKFEVGDEICLEVIPFNIHVLKEEN